MTLQHQGITRGHGPDLRDYLLATRPQFLVASLLPVVLGTAIGYQEIVARGGKFDLLAFLLSMVCVMFVEVGIVHDFEAAFVAYQV